MKIYRWEKFEICMYEFLIYSIRFYIVLFFFSKIVEMWKFTISQKLKVFFSSTTEYID